MRKTVPIATFVLAASLTVLVGYLAKVQWDEARALQGYEHVRLTRIIGLSAWHLKEVFDLELEGLAEAAALPGGSSADMTRQLKSRMDAWRGGSRWPDLPADVYLVSGAAQDPRVARFDFANEVLTEIDWSNDLEPLNNAAKQRLSAAVTLPAGHGAEQYAAVEVPALFAPTTVQWRTGAGLESAWVAVRLDRAYMRKTLFPELFATFYAPPNFADVHVAVVESESGEVVFSTLEIDSLEEFGRADVAYGLLDSGTDGGELPRLGMRPPKGEEAPPNWDRPPTEADHRWFEGFWARVFYSGHWQIYIRRDGVSVADAAASGQQRALLGTLGVLAALCVLIVLIVILARRAQRLAEQQLEFVASVSHELRTPLAVLGVAGENLADSVVSDAESVHRYGDVIQRETRRLRGTIDNVLHLARQKAGAPQPEHSAVDLNRLVEERLATQYTELEAAGITVEHRSARGLAHVYGDARALESAVGNLISNALKYARSGGWLGVSVARAEAEAGQEVRVVIEDRGPGLGSQERPRLFEPFFRGRAAASAEVKGSGLGLAVVADVARSHGGRVTCTNRAEGGARFTLHIPVEASV